ncbi:MAG: GNAT family N-acetyltransferase [Clostridia bacterium]|nr:GNAT family N-acetyltransferase [Clostridia bacterium]
MERFFFERPSPERKADIVEFLDEFVAYGSLIHGAGSLDKIYEGYSFEQALERCLRMEDAAYAKSVGRCPGKTFLLVREQDRRIVGSLNLRWELNEAMLQFGGHIGYSIRPTERRKGYNKINLYLGLQEAQKAGLDRVMIGCTADNLGSDRTIRALDGVLERQGVDPWDGELSNVYWIDVADSLAKNRAVYAPYVSVGR